ncbi:hypothetical protein K2173_025447 [Erythroxylum novogranatense]|uniref:ADP-ribosyl cyclase/cyclic ADP-ribose hydrolase n=1 Tax=Erythroxylum novogranatense TaxID=1862640 RepID=A0AAV8UDU7_9ROSI|nr:hypothetical protein K2173_025447 [Erythroxylum novogranatense]
MHQVLRFSSSTTMASYSSSSSSLASQSPHPWTYDVFISFRGEDTRRSFSGHLYETLCRKALLTFIDDDELQRGEEIAPSLVQAIQESNVAVVVFSKDYASSTWCLDELVKIVECHQTRGQILMPIFYGVDPSHIRNQSDNVATAFEKHEQNLRNAHKIQNWRNALTMTANLSGLHSKDFKYDHILISEIVKDISKKLKKSTVYDGDELLVGVDSHFQQITQALSNGGQDVCIIGIWGMGGIGKTTIAEFIYKRLSFEFEGRCFLKNVREGTKVRDLRKELISQLLGEKEPAFPEKILGRIRALIVLDDVDDSQELDSLIGVPCRFGPQSVIIITGRDMQVLGGRAEFLYEVKPLKDEEALQLFSKVAFNQNYPRNDYESLSSSIVKYAQGNPLALKVLSSSLRDKTTKVWESALKKLSMIPNKKIQDVLQIGFDGLDRMEKDIFLHIACFFKSDNKDIVTQVFQYDADIIDSTISVLVGKCFLTISGNILEVHNLMQEMGKEIVRQESKHPNERSRLWDPKDVFKIFTEDKGAETLESIMLDVSKIQEIDLNPQVFKKTPNLKFLKFYMPNGYDCFEEQSKLRLSQGLDYLPNELTYFHWDGYPLESFPNNFRPNHLIVLGLPNSKIKQFQEEVKDENMRYLVTPQPTFGETGKTLHRYCSLIKTPPDIYGRQLGKVRHLNLANCKNISHLPNSRVGIMEALEVFNLQDCTNLKTFPEVSSNIKSMDLSWTAIEQVPSSSIEHLGKLDELRMLFCDKLESLPSNFFDALTSLRTLNLKNCPRLKKLPEISKKMYNLETLHFGGANLEIPSSFCNLKGLKFLDIYYCPKLTFVRKSNVRLSCLKNALRPLEDVRLYGHDILPELFRGTSSLETLILDRLNFRELPKYLSFLSSVIYLNLSKNNFKSIPNMEQLAHLREIRLSYCQRLMSLPELPPSVIWLQADNCTSLECIRALKQLAFKEAIEKRFWPLKRLAFKEAIEKRFWLWNCSKLDEYECEEVAEVLLRHRKPRVRYHMYYPGSRIPKGVKYQSTGDSVEVPNSYRWLNCDLLTVDSYVCVKSLREDLYFGDLSLSCDCYFGDNNHVSVPDSMICEQAIGHAVKEHVVVVSHDIFCNSIYEHGYSLGDVALFKFNLNYCGASLKIVEWGVTNVFPRSR